MEKMNQTTVMEVQPADERERVSFGSWRAGKFNISEGGSHDFFQV